MSVPTHALAARIPGHLHYDANRLAWAFGYQPEGGDTFSIALSDGSRAFVQWASVSFLELLAGPVPPGVDWAAFGLTEERVAIVLASLQSVVVPIAEGLTLPDHFAAALAAWSVELVEAPGS